MEELEIKVCNQAVRDSLNNIVNIGYTRMYDDSAYKDFFMLVFNTNMEVVANVYVDYNLWRLTDNEYTSVAVAKMEILLSELTLKEIITINQRFYYIVTRKMTTLLTWVRYVQEVCTKRRIISHK